MSNLFIQRSAIMSDCEKYRYVLMRDWDVTKGRLVWVMLNPSTADHEKDDPTICRVTDFTMRFGYGRLDVLNIFALRSSDPKALITAADPVGPNNDDALIQRVEEMDVVVAWGSQPWAARRMDRVCELIHNMRADSVSCLGLTKGGYPRHPLYVRADTELVPFEIG